MATKKKSFFSGLFKGFSLNNTKRRQRKHHKSYKNKKTNRRGKRGG